MSKDNNKSTFQLGGGTFGLLGIGIGLGASHLGFSIFIITANFLASGLYSLEMYLRFK